MIDRGSPILLAWAPVLTSSRPKLQSNQSRASTTPHTRRRHDTKRTAADSLHSLHYKLTTMTTTTNAATKLLNEFVSSSTSSSSSLSPSLLTSFLQRLLSHPSIYNGFSTILHVPLVKTALDQMTNKHAIITTVQLFANGTIGQYHDSLHRQQQQQVEGGGDENGGEETASSSVLVWTLNDAQLDKLRMLTVASVAWKHVSQQQLLLMNSSKGAGEGSGSSSRGRDNGATSPDVEMKRRDGCNSCLQSTR